MKRQLWTVWTAQGRRRRWGTRSRRPLIEENNNDMQEGYDETDNIEEQSHQSTVNIVLEELAEFLGVDPDASTSEDGPCCSGQENSNAVCLIQSSVSNNFPELPADLDQNLQQHLSNMQERMCNTLVKMGPLLERFGLMGCLLDCYHRQTFDHLSDLLMNIQFSKNYLVVMKWVLQSYLSQDLLGHPSLQEMDAIKKVDLLLCIEWVAKTKDKLLETVKKEVRKSLEKILLIEKSQEDCDHEEACVGLYVDTIQCIDAIPKEAQKISSKLSADVQEVCFQELLMFLQSYTTHQSKILNKKAKLDKPEMTHFLKTLKTCKELKKHIQTENKGISKALLQAAAAALENMEAFTLKLLKQIVADFAESHLKNYFKQEKYFSLIREVETHFPKLRWCQDVHNRVMDEAYKLIVHVYLKHLIQSSQSKLSRCWSIDVVQAVTEDAELLHKTFADMAPDVQQWNLTLSKIPELLKCKSTDEVKLTVASMQQESLTWSEDQDLLPALLRWTGLSGRKVREVLDALPGQRSRPRSTSWYSSICCCQWMS
uniref:exocyst complex component 3 n=1 Tax=Scatophagus argus TaxID=75038 RepID=UPI001ED85FD0|nr:exocyst complex component 3 [Scatophagus argus]